MDVVKESSQNITKVRQRYDIKPDRIRLREKECDSEEKLADLFLTSAWRFFSPSFLD